MALCLFVTSLLAVFSTVNAQNVGGSRGRHHAPGNRVVLTSRGEASLSEKELDAEADKKPGWVNDNTHTFVQNVNGSTPTGWMQLGTPPKWLFVIFDTGSDKLVAKTWDTVANELASIDQGIDGMVVPSKLLYNHKESSTYVRKYMMDPKTNKSEPERKEISYGSGSAITDEGNETVIMGIFKLPNFSLSEITQDSLTLLHTKKGVAGVLGLQHMMNRSLGRSLFSRMRDAGKFTSFSYCRGTGNNGTFLWGDTSTEGHEIEVLGQMHWAVALGVMKVHSNESAGDGSLAHKNHTTGVHHHNAGTVVTQDQGSLIDRQPSDGSSPPEAEDYDEQNEASEDETALPCAGNKCVGILDSGSNILAGPKSVMTALSKKINMAQDCSNFDQLPTITLIFGGQNVSISPEGYTMKVPMPDWAKMGGGGSSFDGQGHGDGSGELLDQQGKRQKSGLGWKAVFEHLKKNRGIDLSAAMRDTPDVDVDKQPAFMCMPALVPLDKLTGYKKEPLYIIGTPLLQTHYARWSHKAGTDEKPKIFIKKLSDTQVCKDAKPTQHHPSSESLEAAARVNAPLIRSEQRHLSQAPPSGAKGPFIRHIDDISFPHWAQHVDTL